jgi:hypothetical protein
MPEFHVIELSRQFIALLRQTGIESRQMDAKMFLRNQGLRSEIFRRCGFGDQIYPR